MSITYDVAQLLSGVATSDTAERVLEVGDVIDVISKANVEYTNADTYTAFLGSDENVPEDVDEYGNPSENSNANVVDRNYQSYSIEFPKEIDISIDIPELQFADYGISYAALNAPAASMTQVDAANMYRNINNGVVGAKSIANEVASLIEKVYLKERAQVGAALDALESSTDARYYPYSQHIIGDASDRPNYWNFDNKGTAAIDATELENRTDAMQKQKSFFNAPIGKQNPVFFLHGSKISAVEKLVFPDKTVNVQNRSILDLRASGYEKMCGTYAASGANHWIMISDRAIKNKSFRRVYSTKILGLAIPGSNVQNGYVVSIIPDQLGKKVKIRVQSLTMFIITSPVGFDKSIV